MWLHAPDHCSIPKDSDAIACLIAMPCDRIATALQEIQNAHAPLLRESEECGGRYVSNGLKKEIEKMQDRRNKAVTAANQRWNKSMRTQCERNANASFEQCSPTPTPTPTSSPTPSPTPTNKGGRFVKPTDQEVSEYAKSINFVLSGDDFVDFYESKGWLIGKNPMRDWKAAVRTWKSKRTAENEKAQKPKPRNMI
jgi:hypothetical protein